MKKYLFLIKNSFLENNLHFISTFFTVVEPIFELLGFVFLYSFLQNKTAGLNSEVVVYFMTIFAISSVNPKRIMGEIKKDFKEERFLILNQRPINPFKYYFSINLGRHLISLSIGLLLGLATLGYYRYSIETVLMFIPTVLASIVLLNLIYFWISTLRFKMKYFSNTLYHVIIEFLSGKLIPVTLFPALFFTSMKFLPFIYASGQVAKDISLTDFKHLILSLAILIVWAIIVQHLSLKAWFKGSNLYQERM